MLRYYTCVTKTGYNESTHTCSFFHFADVGMRCLYTRIPERCTRILVPRITTIQRAHLSGAELHPPLYMYPSKKQDTSSYVYIVIIYYVLACYVYSGMLVTA